MKRAVTKVQPRLPEAVKRCKHSWSYFGGQCTCTKCGYSLHPDGRITRTRTGGKR